MYTQIQYVQPVGYIPIDVLELLIICHAKKVSSWLAVKLDQFKCHVYGDLA